MGGKCSPPTANSLPSLTSYPPPPCGATWQPPTSPTTGGGVGSPSPVFPWPFFSLFRLDAAHPAFHTGPCRRPRRRVGFRPRRPSPPPGFGGPSQPKRGPLGFEVPPPSLPPPGPAPAPGQSPSPHTSLDGAVGSPARPSPSRAVPLAGPQAVSPALTRLPAPPPRWNFEAWLIPPLCKY